MEAKDFGLPVHWKIKELVQLTKPKNISYGIVQPGKHVEGGIPIIRVNNFTDSGVNVSETLNVLPAIALKSQKTKLEEGDVLLTLVGSTGLTYIVPKEYVGWNVARAVAVIKSDGSVSSDWIKICLNSEFTKHFLDSRANTTVQKTLNLSDVKLIPIPIPPRNERSFIEKNITSINKKIYLNQQTNETLEQMAQTLFKSWFVDFDPVFDNLLAKVDFKIEYLESTLPEELVKKAKIRLLALNGLAEAAQTKASLKALAQGLSPQSSEILPQHATTHINFPNEFEHNEQLGWIPKGWEDVTVNEMVNTVSDTYPLKTVDEVIFLNTGDILDGKFLHKIYSKTQGLPGQAKKSIKKGDILYSEIRPKNKRFALVNFDGDEHVVSTKLMVLRPHEGFEELFPYFVLTQDQNISLLQRAAESRSGTFPQITFTELAMIKVAMPKDRGLVDIFTESYLKNHFAQKDQRDFQNETLIHIRDTLLPKLISGELQIPDEEASEEKII